MPEPLKALNLFNSEGRHPANFQEILLVLSTKGPMIKNEVAKTLGRREGDISKRVDWLMEYDFLYVRGRRIKKSRFREIRLNEYHLTPKGICAVSHRSDFDPVRALSFYDLPEVLKELLASFGSANLRAYINKVANMVKDQLDQTPEFEYIKSNQFGLLIGPLLTNGLVQLPILIGSSGLDEPTRAKVQQVLARYSNQIVSWLESAISTQKEAIEGLEKLKSALQESKGEPSKLNELFTPKPETASQKGVRS